MSDEKKDITKKQKDLAEWIRKQEKTNIIIKDKKDNNKKQESSKLAFGYGYNPDWLKDGIRKYNYSHKLKNGIKLYEFQPKLSYRIFNELSKVLKYECIGNELRKENTTIKNDHFTTDQNPEKIIAQLNIAIKKLFEMYEPVPAFDVQ